MNKYQEALEFITDHTKADCKTIKDLEGLEFAYDILQELVDKETPTFDEVVKAWEDTIDDSLEFKNNDEGIRINYPNGIYYLINLEQVYSNRKVFSMNVNATLYAINLTIRYLQAKE